MADPRRVTMIMNTAHSMMKANRGGRLKGIRRSIRRSFEFGTGKKTALKIAIGLGLGAVAVGVSAATAGAGAPVIAALAVGAFASGQLTNIGFSKLSGRSYRGVQRTNSWIEDYRRGSDDHSEGLKATNARAHKTIRRAFEHYRRGVRKASVMKEAYREATTAQTCDAAANLVARMFSVSHHWDKSRLYAVPGLFLCQVLLDTYLDMLRLFRASEEGMETRLGELLDAHGPNSCSSDACIAKRALMTVPANRSARWDPDRIREISEILNEHEDRLLSAGFASAAPGVIGPAQIRTQQMFRDVGRAYRANRKRLHVKISHGIKNVFARKTTGERAAVGAGVVLSGGMAAAGGGISGATASMDMPAFFDPLLELGFQLVENASGEAIDSASAQADRGAGTTDLAHHREGTKAGKESQESLQKAAEHMQEIIKIEEELKESGGVEPNDCDALLERLRVFYKIDHHLDKVEAYLGDAVSQIDVLAGALGDKMDRFVPAHDRIWELTGEIISRRDHSNCQGVCYKVGGTPRRVH